MVALTTDTRLKHVFVFDEDIDIFNEVECLFAIATRSQWDKDVMIFPNTRGIIVDPSIPGNLTTKGGIDCTKPVGEAFSERNRIDEDVNRRIQIADYIAKERLEKIRLENM